MVVLILSQIIAIRFFFVQTNPKYEPINKQKNANTTIFHFRAGDFCYDLNLPH